MAVFISDWLVPNRALSRRAMTAMAALQAALSVCLWAGSGAAVLPTPREVAAALGALLREQGLLRELLESLVLSLQAVAVSSALSLALSWATVLPVLRPVAAAVSRGRFLGLTGLTFVFTLAIGGGHPLKLALLVFGMTVFLTTGLCAEIAAIPRERFEHARTLGMGEWAVAREVVVLGTLDRALELLRQNAAIGWTMLSMVEGLARSEGGVGALLLNQNKHFHLAAVFAIQLSILAVGLLQDASLGALARLVCPWASLRREAR